MLASLLWAIFIFFNIYKIPNSNKSSARRQEQIQKLMHLHLEN